MYDLNHNGTIEANELKIVLAKLGRQVTDDQVAAMVKR
jgi:Ca2+-binding EF-hand superfamily protein